MILGVPLAPQRPVLHTSGLVLVVLVARVFTGLARKQLHDGDL